MSTLPYIIYHSPCLDGFGAAYAAWREFGSEARYIPYSHGAPIPELEWGTDVFMLDISFKRPILKEFAQKHNWVTIIDHHVTAKDDLSGIELELPNVDVVFDMERSGAALAWQYFHEGSTLPRLLAHVEDRDLWKFTLPKTAEVNAALNTHPFTFEAWDELRYGVNQLITEGAVLLRLQKQQIEALLPEARLAYFQVEGELVRVPAINAPFWLSSDLGNAMLKHYPNAPFSATYRDMGKGTRAWSLRSEDSRADVSAVAKALGGGGHRNAAGFTEDCIKHRVLLDVTGPFAEVEARIQQLKVQ